MPWGDQNRAGSGSVQADLESGEGVRRCRTASTDPSLAVERAEGELATWEVEAAAAAVAIIM
jgi:hypothetical protein